MTRVAHCRNYRWFLVPIGLLLTTAMWLYYCDNYVCEHENHKGKNLRIKEQ